MTELNLIKLTQFAFAFIQKPIPKGYVMKSTGENVVELLKFEDSEYGFSLWGNSNKPVGFYFKDDNIFELRSKYDGHTLYSVKGYELENIIKKLNN